MAGASRAHMEHKPPQQVVERETARLVKDLLGDMLLNRAQRRSIAGQIRLRILSVWRHVSPEIISDAVAVHEAAEVVRIDGDLQADLAAIRRQALIRHWLVAFLGSMLWVTGMLSLLHFMQPTETKAAFTATALPPEPIISAILVGFTIGLLSAQKGWFFGGVSVTGGLILMMLMYKGVFYGSIAYLVIFLPLVISSGAFGGVLADVLRQQAQYGERN